VAHARESGLGTRRREVTRARVHTTPLRHLRAPPYHGRAWELVNDPGLRRQSRASLGATLAVERRTTRRVGARHDVVPSPPRTHAETATVPCINTLRRLTTKKGRLCAHSATNSCPSFLPRVSPPFIARHCHHRRRAPPPLAPAAGQGLQAPL
jgi:hypothetical protein